MDSEQSVGLCRPDWYFPSWGWLLFLIFHISHFFILFPSNIIHVSQAVFIMLPAICHCHVKNRFVPAVDFSRSIWEKSISPHQGTYPKFPSKDIQDIASFQYYIKTICTRSGSVHRSFFSPGNDLFLLRFHVSWKQEGRHFHHWTLLICPTGQERFQPEPCLTWLSFT